MHIPVIAQLAATLLPFFQTPTPSAPPPSADTLAFRPIHAHAHSNYRNGASNPHLLLHDASRHVSEYRATSGSSGGNDQPESTYANDALHIRTRPITIRRPRSRPPHMTSWARSYFATQPGIALPHFLSVNGNKTYGWRAPDYDDAQGDWDDVEIPGPDVTDRQTLIALAKMTSNAYILPGTDEWWPVKGWNDTIPFGWEADADGLRGHIFADAKNETVIISIKGTSAGVLGSGGPTAKNDKFNDNLLFSCCCARVDFSWSTVCDCYAGGYNCKQTCLEKALVEDSVYATVGTVSCKPCTARIQLIPQNLYNNVTYMYPNANIWLVGHSLGGSVSAMIGLAFGSPVVTFEAPGDRLPSRRLHLPQPPGVPSDKTGITHVYHTADPVPQGACTGSLSGCYAAGFALESKCHTGQTILYDTVTVKGWSVDVRTHRIGEIINKVLVDPWPTESPDEPDEDLQTEDLGGWINRWGWGRRGPPKGKKGEGGDDGDDDDDDEDGHRGWEKHGGVPPAKAEDDCVDCYKWEFGDHFDNKTES